MTKNQLVGEIGEAAARLQFLKIGFQFDPRSRLEAGIDAIVEVMDHGKPLAKMIAVQVKTTDNATYPGEDSQAFYYLLKKEDLSYWRGSNLPIIIVLYRRSDETFFWKEIPRGEEFQDRRLNFNKREDVLDGNSADKLGALTVPSAGFGYYVPPLGGGEEALVNMLPVTLPAEVFVSTTPHTRKQAAAILLEDEEPARFDWVIKGDTFWSFHDPRHSVCRRIVDMDQVEAIGVEALAFHEDVDERNNFSYLLKQTLGHQVRHELAWDKEKKLYYFRAKGRNTPRTFKYESAKKATEAEVVNVVRNKNDRDRVAFVRHHAFVPRFESFYDEWFLILEPTYHFTFDGFTPHTYPDALLSGKKRLDKSASLRGQVIMWHRFLASLDPVSDDLFAVASGEPRLSFGAPPAIELPTKVPEDVWGSPKKDEFEREQDLLDRQ
ncbi:DUF4365 domain-containing protein [Rhizobium oryzicola]|uniref:DUF4365 domain-containing protein n=1 Tax=Rhizobium oryzicola TaxID=1232668 RepID=A0ABT8T5J4_9HYPH|nr:DUF4365 domain-containing protein [Rhizobium oryzicola]MDO1585634.1 DUF4365 domain-containing protein [Rhizobium oryzicola]